MGVAIKGVVTRDRFFPQGLKYHIRLKNPFDSDLSLWKKGFRARSWRERPGLRTRPKALRVVLGPYVQYCQCEASEQKLGQKQKSELKEIELCYCHHSICL